MEFSTTELSNRRFWTLQ